MSLPVVLITHTLSFVDPNDLPPLAEVSQTWHRVTLSRIRASALATIGAFASYIQTRLDSLDPVVTNRFFTQCNLQQFQDPRLFMQCNGLRDMQQVTEVMRWNIEEALVDAFNYYEIADITIQELDNEENRFNYGFEKIFFLTEMRRSLQNITFDALYTQAEKATAVRQIIRSLTAHRCGIRALEVMNNHPVLLEALLQPDISLRAAARTNSYISLAFGFLDRKDLLAALEMVHLFPICLSRDIAGLSDDLLTRSKNEMKVAVFEAMAVIMIINGRPDIAHLIRSNLDE